MFDKILGLCYDGSESRSGGGVVKALGFVSVYRWSCYIWVYNEADGVFQLWCIGLRVVAAKAVYELGFSTITRIEIGECGCIGPVIKMLGWYGSGGERSYSKGLIDFNIVSWVYEVFQEGWEREWILGHVW